MSSSDTLHYRLEIVITKCHQNLFVLVDLIFEDRTVGLTLLGLGSSESMSVWGGVLPSVACKPNQVIQIETSHGSCLIRFEQPTKFPGPSSCLSCIRFGSLTFQSSQSVDRLIVEQLFRLTPGITPDGSCSCSIMLI